MKCEFFGFVNGFIAEEKSKMMVKGDNWEISTLVFASWPLGIFLVYMFLFGGRFEWGVASVTALID